MKLPSALGPVLLFSVLFAVGCKRKTESELTIVGGRPVTNNDNGPEKISTVKLYDCTGTIIAKDLVLTAAHCYDPVVNRGKFVAFGLQALGQGVKVINIAAADKNSQYKDSSNDFAMLKLAQDIPAGYQAVKLLPPTIPLNPGDSVRLAGYGRDNSKNFEFNTLRTVDSKFVGPTQLGALEVRDGSKGACSGDSGGPLFIQKNNSWYVAGILSAGLISPDGTCPGGDEYTSVARNYDAILGMARKLTGRQDPLPAVATAPVPSGGSGQVPGPAPTDPGRKSGPTGPAPGQQPTTAPTPAPGGSPAAPVNFQDLTGVTRAGNVLSMRLKNVTGRELSNCNFTLTPTRTLLEREFNYKLSSIVGSVGKDQTVDVKFIDDFEGKPNISPILRAIYDYGCQ